MVVTSTESIKVEALLTDVRSRVLCVLINGLFAGQASDLSLTDALDIACDIIDSHRDGSAIETRASDGH